MLVLTRRISESLHLINPDGSMSKIIVLGVKGNQVRIGIDAPKDIKILREELKDNGILPIQDNNEHFL